MDPIRQSLTQLERWFSRHQGTITAFSGGVDSALVLFLSRRFLGKPNAIGCISDSPSLKRSDLQLAKSFCQQFDIRLEVINTNEIDDPAYNTNPINRCFACKTHLYQDLSKLLQRFPGYVALNGTNTDDLGDYRPGLKAAANHHTHSPLAECGVDKRAVRAIAKRFNLPNWDKPASPCLSSRIPYGESVTREKLSQIESAEAVLAAYGFTDARVRHLGSDARVEVPQSQLDELHRHWPKIEQAIRGLGFKNSAVDEEGLVSGKLNRAIS